MPKRRQGVVLFSAVLLTIVLITGLLRHYFQDYPPPRFDDLYLIAVLVLAYRNSWKSAAALAGASLLLAAYLLAPLDGADRFELASFAGCAIVIVLVTAAIQRRNRARSALHSESEAQCPSTIRSGPAPRY